MSTDEPVGAASEAMEPWGVLEHLTAERNAQGREGVVLVTLDLADRRNAMTEPMTRSWYAVMRALRDDRSVRAVVVTGSGSAFCAGGDFSWLGATPDADVPALRERMRAFYRDWLSVLDVEVPVIAAVNGAAIGAGLAVALACDVRVAADDARLAAPFTSLGLHPGMATTALLRRAAGDTVARDMLLTGRSVPGREAVVSGLVSRSVPPGHVLDTALDVAADVAAAAPMATALTKASLGPGGPATLAQALEWEGLAQPITLATDDLVEGLAAARERRAPEFRSR
jgi:enoyl-CoA hydratase/carnithine racemase